MSSLRSCNERSYENYLNVSAREVDSTSTTRALLLDAVLAMELVLLDNALRPSQVEENIVKRGYKAIELKYFGADSGPRNIAQ